MLKTSHISVSYGMTTYTNNVLGLSSQTTGTSKTYYVREPSGAAVAQRRYTGSTFVDTDYFVNDALGSTVGLLNGTSTNLVRSYSYDPDGAATGAGTGPTTGLKFAGGYALPNGLYHFGARYYNPAIGRWTQQDPLNQIGSLTEANRYAYVRGDPVNNVDPSGTITGPSPYSNPCYRPDGSERALPSYCTRDDSGDDVLICSGVGLIGLTGGPATAVRGIAACALVRAAS